MSHETDPVPEAPILIIDDDRELLALLLEYLAGEGEAARSAYDGPSGLEAALTGQYPLVVLDVMLPGLSGFEVLRQLRERSTLPVIMLTARGEDQDKITGLELGADDYLSKPFNPRELLARIRAVRRRTAAVEGGRNEQGSATLSVGELAVNRLARWATQAGQRLPLTGVELEMLHLLLASAGQVVSRDALSTAALSRPFDPRDRSVDIHISSLRRKLQRAEQEESSIKTVRGEGYVFVPVGRS